MKRLEQLLRRHLCNFQGVNDPRSDLDTTAEITLLDRNENPFNKPYNRYADTSQRELRNVLAPKKGLDADNIFIANGLEQLLDLTIRIFCDPCEDNVVVVEPTYSAIKSIVAFNNVGYRSALLTDTFQLNASHVLTQCDEHTKLIFIASPNNTTGNVMDKDELVRLINGFEGLVILDESYSDFHREPRFSQYLDRFPNLVVISTMAHSWASAGLNIGIAYTNKTVIDIYNKVRTFHLVSSPAQDLGLKMLQRDIDKDDWKKLILNERTTMMKALAMLPFCTAVFPSDANFFMARFTDAKAVYDYLLAHKLLVCDVSTLPLCNNCLRMTIGSKTENAKLIGALRQFEGKG